MTSPANIDKYTTPFKEYPPDILQFAKENNIQLPGIKTLKGQALTLMAQPEIRGKCYIDRGIADRFFAAIGESTADSIQPFNKPPGFEKKICSRGKYILKYPYVCNTTDIIKRKGAVISTDRDSAINEIKKWWQKNMIDIPNKDWQLGHLDPTIPDASEGNLAYQPPIQSKFRDRFKFDSLFQKMWPTAKELIPKVDQYYTEIEQLAIYEALKKKFEK